MEPELRFPPNILVDGKERRLAGSGFAITINTNQSPQGEDPEARRRDEILRRADLKQAVMRILRSPTQRSQLFLFREPYQDDFWSNTVIKRLKVHSLTTELGGKQNRVHANLNFGVTHYSKIHVDRHFLRQAILDNLFNKSIGNVHLNIRAFNLNAITLARYNNKERGTEKGRQINDLADRLASLSVN